MCRDTIINRADPIQISTLVLSPAALRLNSLSKPIAPPHKMASTSFTAITMFSEVVIIIAMLDLSSELKTHLEGEGEFAEVVVICAGPFSLRYRSSIEIT